MSAKRIFLIIILAGIVFFVGRSIHMQIAYAEVEGLTTQHGSELSSAVNQSIANDPLLSAEGVTSRLEYFKVFEYSENQAKVFVVISYEATQLKAPVMHDWIGQFRYFVRQNGDWVIDQSKRPYELVWDALGSGDDETWPPYH